MKRTLPFLLSFLLLFPFLIAVPVNAAAAGSVWISVDEETTVVLNDETPYYDNLCHMAVSEGTLGIGGITAYYSGDALELCGLTSGTLETKNVSVIRYYGENNVTACGGEYAYGLYVYGTPVTLEGHGTLNILAGPYADYEAYGLYAYTALTINGGNLNIWAGNSGDEYSCGIYCNRDLVIRNCALTAVAGTTDESSYGIYSCYNLSVEDSVINACGASCSEYAAGVAADGDIRFDRSEIYAYAGDSGYFACAGIYSHYGTVDVNDSRVFAVGGDVGNDSTGTSGILSEGLTLNGGELIAYGGMAARYETYGILCYDGTVTVNAGTLIALGGYCYYSGREYDSPSFGIEAAAFEANGGITIAEGGYEYRNDFSYGIYLRDSFSVSDQAVVVACGERSARGQAIGTDFDLPELPEGLQAVRYTEAGNEALVLAPADWSVITDQRELSAQTLSSNTICVTGNGDANTAYAATLTGNVVVPAGKTLIAANLAYMGMEDYTSPAAGLLVEGAASLSGGGTVIAVGGTAAFSSGICLEDGAAFETSVGRLIAAGGGFVYNRDVNAVNTSTTINAGIYAKPGAGSSAVRVSGGDVLLLGKRMYVSNCPAISCGIYAPENCCVTVTGGNLYARGGQAKVIRPFSSAISCGIFAEQSDASEYGFVMTGGNLRAEGNMANANNINLGGNPLGMFLSAGVYASRAKITGGLLKASAAKALILTAEQYHRTPLEHFDAFGAETDVWVAADIHDPGSLWDGAAALDSYDRVEVDARGICAEVRNGGVTYHVPVSLSGNTLVAAQYENGRMAAVSLPRPSYRGYVSFAESDAEADYLYRLFVLDPATAIPVCASVPCG